MAASAPAYPHVWPNLCSRHRVAIRAATRDVPMACTSTRAPSRPLGWAAAVYMGPGTRAGQRQASPCGCRQRTSTHSTKRATEGVQGKGMVVGRLHSPGLCGSPRPRLPHPLTCWVLQAGVGYIILCPPLPQQGSGKGHVCSWRDGRLAGGGRLCGSTGPPRERDTHPVLLAQPGRTGALVCAPGKLAHAASVSPPGNDDAGERLSTQG